MLFAHYKTISFILIPSLYIADVLILNYARINKVELDNYYYISSKSFNPYTRDFIKLITLIVILYHVPKREYFFTTSGPIVCYIIAVTSLVYSFVRCRR
jgi:hypothetical protein